MPKSEAETVASAHSCTDCTVRGCTLFNLPPAEISVFLQILFSEYQFAQVLCAKQIKCLFLQPNSQKRVGNLASQLLFFFQTLGDCLRKAADTFGRIDSPLHAEADGSKHAQFDLVFRCLFVDECKMRSVGCQKVRICCGLNEHRFRRWS